MRLFYQNFDDGTYNLNNFLADTIDMIFPLKLVVR